METILRLVAIIMCLQVILLPLAIRRIYLYKNHRSNFLICILFCSYLFYFYIFFGFTDDPVRLVDGDQTNKGRVEILKNGQWSSVCDYGFGTSEAAVICKMMNMMTS